MSWKRDRPEQPRGYHHGNLKEELVRAALGLIGEKGPNGFTFAEAARIDPRHADVNRLFGWMTYALPAKSMRWLWSLRGK